LARARGECEPLPISHDFPVARSVQIVGYEIMATEIDELLDEMSEHEARARLGNRFAYAVRLGVAYCARCATEVRGVGELEQFAAYRTAMKVARLMAWIDGHFGPEPCTFNGDGTLTVAAVAFDASGRRFVEREVIPATISAARDLLGY
jgi:hypothetical protein